MSLVDTEFEARRAGELLTSPFSVPQVEAPALPARSAPVSASLETPFAEALADVGEAELEEQAVDALAAELEDEEFTGALEALVAEASGRHLRSTGAWSHEADGARLAATEVEQWLEALAAEADHRLGQLEDHYADRPVDAVSEAELEAMVAPTVQSELLGPVDVQEQFLGGLIRKAGAAVRGVAKLVKRGVALAGKVLPTGRIFAVLRKLVRPLLRRVLAKAIGSLPPALRPVARRLAGRLPSVLGVAQEDAEQDSTAGLGEFFDSAVAEAVLAPSQTSPLASEFEAEAGARDAATELEQLDDARRQLTQDLAEAQSGADPTAQMEQFIPAVMAVMPLVKLGVKVVGRQRIVGFLAGLLADLVRPMVGPQIAQPLSRHVADAGLRLLGLEAESGSTVGAEALVAATEDTIREVMALPEASLQQELLLEAAVQQAFEDAAVRAFPTTVLRAGLGRAGGEDERGIWVPMPRGTGARRRYRRYSLAGPVTIDRLTARTVVFREGDTLEERLLDEGVSSWPVSAEVETYELLPGGTVGHLAAFEVEDEAPSTGALQFAELEDEGRLPVPVRRGLGAARGSGPRLVRLRVGGRPVRRRRRFALRWDLTGPAPSLALSLHVSERLAHEWAGALARRQLAPVVATVRRLVGPAWQSALAARLLRSLSRHGIALPEGGSATLAAQLAASVERVVAARLPEAAAALATAAKDPAPGVTFTFTFPFADRDAVTRGAPGEPTLGIRAGSGRA